MPSTTYQNINKNERVNNTSSYKLIGKNKGDLKIQDDFGFSDFIPTDLISYLLFGFTIAFLDIFAIPYLLQRISSSYASFREKAGFSVLIIVLVMAPLYSFYLGYCGTLLYEIWPVNFLDFLIGGFILTICAILYSLFQTVGSR
jgi:hypothetical protein